MQCNTWICPECPGWVELQALAAIITAMKRLLPLLLCLALPALPGALAEGLPDLGESARADLPHYLERRIGEIQMREIRLKEPTYVDDPELSGYLDRLARRLILASDDPSQETETFVLRDPTLNAFAMPGGFIGVHTGLITATQSESELAGVIAHETAHVTQHHLARQVNSRSEANIYTLLSLAVAVLAARSNSDVAQGALIGGQAAGIQAMLSYSRDFEREADRFGLQRLERAGFDVRGMGAFFERLDKFGRLYENNAPAYLRTHPLTTERMSDIQNRIHARPYRQVPDSLDYQLVRAKLLAEEGTAEDAETLFRTQLKERKFLSEAAAHYGLGQAALRAKNLVAADREMTILRQTDLESPMFETMAAKIRTLQGRLEEAAGVLRQARVRYPRDRAINYDLVDSLLEGHRAEEALPLTVIWLRDNPADDRMHGLQARTYSQLGRVLQQHRAQAEAYVYQGQLLAAIEQLHLAQKAPDGDFYERSQVDARLRELKVLRADEIRDERR